MFMFNHIEKSVILLILHFCNEISCLSTELSSSSLMLITVLNNGLLAMRLGVPVWLFSGHAKLYVEG